MENVINAADENQVRELGKKEKVKFNREVDDLKFLLNQPQFKRFIWDVLTFCGVNASPFNTNAAITNLNIGRGDVGRYLMAKINDANPASLVTMKEEVTKNV